MAAAPSPQVQALLPSVTPGWNRQDGLPQVVTYSFAEDGLGWNQGGNQTPLAPGQWAAFDAAQRESARQALAAWSASSGLEFVEVPDQPAGLHVDVRFRLEAGFAPDIAGEGYFPPIGAIAVSLGSFARSPMAPGSYGYYVLLHEAGHAVGLKHPFEGDAVLPADQDNTDQTVLAYSIGPSGTPAHLGPLDVQAAQYIYGTPADAAAMGLQSSYDAAQDRVVIRTGAGTQPVHGVGYREEIHAGDGPRTITGGDGDTIIHGGAGGQAIQAGNGPNHIHGGSGDDTILGGAGSDWLAGGPGDNTIDGSQGVNILVFETARRAVTLDLAVGPPVTIVARLTAATVTGTATTSGETDHFRNISDFGFADGRLVFNASDPAAEVMRLYDAAFGRAPDGAGLHAWTAALQAGTSPHDVAQGFASSAEFAARYGAPDDAGYVTALYRNSLHREPDTTGLNDWVNLLASGQQDRAAVLLDFSDSAEHQALTAPQMAAGIWDPDPVAAGAARLYLTAFRRVPDLGGLLNWTAAEQAGLSPHAVADSFLHSAEFGARNGVPDDAGLVTLLYQDALGRPPDAAGQANWTNALATGALDRPGLLLAFADSGEAQAHFAPLTEGGITFA
ncbi:MAG: DUF4214 domain-containing protein [Acetobacteraceae bacterium]|nr:DUF4214 domain-containing protein [Acetobacteraceae bacterium]